MTKSIFEQVKDQVTISDVVAYYCEDELVPLGSNNVQLSDKSCPLCGHKDCFSIREAEVDEPFFKCFSCDEKGDAIEFVAKFKNISPVEATRLIAKDFKIKLVEKKLSVSERILHATAEYYHTNLLENGDKVFEKDGKAYSGSQYQVEVRNHKVTQLVNFRVGLSDGGLCTYLLAIGFTEAEVLDAGVVTRYEGGKLQDYFAPNLFIYPMVKEGVVSSFTQKDPTGKLRYQFSGRHRLNDILFFNQDAAKKAEKIYIVEGQNDVLSMYDDGLQPNEAVIGTCGSISQDQLKWMEAHLRKKKITTIFDRDEAGDIYREKVGKVLPQAIHIKFPEDAKWKDIDDLIRDGLHIQDAFKYVQEKKEVEEPKIAPAGDVDKASSVSVPSYDPQLNILEKDGCYFKVKVNKEDGEQLIPLSDFTLKLKNVFVIEGRRIREVQIVRSDGARSTPILMDSTTKVSVANFKAKVADAIDANFYGREDDLTQIWRYVYKKGSERMVFLPDHIGRIEDDGGWLFRNCYIKPDGSEIITPDASGVMWVNGNTRGIRPQSISSSLEQDIYSKKLKDIPVMKLDISEEEVEAMKEQFVKLYAQNLGDKGKALLLIGWSMMNAFSDRLFEHYGFTPFMFMWGGHGTGKTSLIQWLLSLYDMKDTGYSTLPNLKSGVGFERKLGYYSSLPVSVDELRAGKEMLEFSGRFRSWYNRVGRSMADSKDHKAIIQLNVRSNFLFGGQDMFTDDALRQRTIVVRISKDNREMQESYREICKMEAGRKLSAIGLSWILESLTCDYDKLIMAVEEMSNILLDGGVRQRNSKVWAIVGVFAERLSQEYFPDFNFREFLISACKEDESVQVEGGFLNQFFERVEGLMYQEFSKLTVEHFKVENDVLYMWFTDIYRVMNESKRDPTEEIFTKEAVKSALKEEEYFMEEKITRMGVAGVSRRVMTFDLKREDLPGSLKSIAHFVSQKF